MDKRTDFQKVIGKIVRNTNLSASMKCDRIDKDVLKIIDEWYKKHSQHLNHKFIFLLKQKIQG